MLALLDFDAYIALEPHDSEGYFSRAHAFGKLDQYDRPIEDYSEAIRLDPQYAMAYTTTGPISTTN